ncbi:MAG TPA: NAD(P) transhydrogenase subunit alpha [Phycisphaerae bacterium]|nr:NAD(P) transhydrogenase subunit alpha [Phycisphaerae bacterium]
MPLKLMSWLLGTALILLPVAGAVAQAPTTAAPAAKPAVSHQAPATATPPAKAETKTEQVLEKAESLDFMSMVFVFMLATFIGIGVIIRVSRLLHTPLMSLTNAISAIAVVGSIIVAGGGHYTTPIRVLGAIALFCSMTNIISGFLITDRMLKMFKTRPGGKE